MTRAAHWTTPLLARAYVPGEYDCVDLVREAVRVVRGFDIDVAIPDRMSRRWTKEKIDGYFGRHVREVPSHDGADDGDLILMRVKGRKRDIGSHVGVYVAAPHGTPCVLHCVEGVGVRLHAISSLEHFGRYIIAGIYKWL